MAFRITALSIAVVFLWSASASAGQSKAKAGYISALMLVMIVSTPVAANVDPEGDHDRNGLYVGAGPSLAFSTFEDEVQSVFRDALPNADVAVKDSFGANARLGYRVHPRISGEVEFEWLSGFVATVTDQNLGLDKEEFADVESWIVTGNVKGYLLTGPIQPFGVVGLGAIRAEDQEGLGAFDDTTDLAVRFGAGVDLYVSPRFVLNFKTDYVYPTDSLRNDLDYISIGASLLYRF